MTARSKNHVLVSEILDLSIIYVISGVSIQSSISIMARTFVAIVKPRTCSSTEQFHSKQEQRILY